MTAQFSTLSDFLGMGGYAGFVFGAWGLSFAVIVALIGRAIIFGKKQRTRLSALERERDGQ
jgi:heme exporter protein D